jgi:hypothetical protein
MARGFGGYVRSLGGKIWWRGGPPPRMGGAVPAW